MFYEICGLDIDASEIISNKKEAKKTYKYNQGYMPMVGHIAEINNLDESEWDRVTKSDGTESQMSSHRTTHNISDYKKPFTLIIQRTPKSGLLELARIFHRISQKKGIYLFFLNQAIKR